jgi:DNA invertase Pin-like site-specific DNA recombinase
MKSTMGRPRRATDAQVEFILKWAADYMAWLAKRPKIGSRQELAKHLGLSRTTVQRIIAESGHYKQITPEQHAAHRAIRRKRMRQIE